MQPLDRCRVGFDQAAVILGEVADGRLVSPERLARIDEGAIVAAGLAQFSLGSRRRICEQGV